jgi:hypothetical protein
MAGNAVTLTFGGDATALQRAAQQATQATDAVADSVTSASNQMGSAAQESTDLTTKLGHLGSAVDGATTAIDSIGGSVQAFADIQNMASNRAAEQARKVAAVEQASIDLEQATVDLTQANLDLGQSFLDGKQAGVDAQQALIDAKQATLDAQVAQEDYNAAVKEHGKDSAEAKQALIDLEQAQADLNQAHLDGEQAAADAAQATNDGKQATLDATQAVRSGKDAQLDLNEAMTAANPTGLQKWADKIQLLTPLLTAVIGVVGLVTAAQWAWNAAQAASPTTWIVIGIVALIAAIVLVATKTTWFQATWEAVWGVLKAIGAWFAGPFADFFVATWDAIVGAATAVGAWFAGPFAGFFVALWNNVVGAVVWVKDRFIENWNKIKSFVGGVGDFIAGIPGKLKNAFSAVTSAIFAPFRAAFNMVADAWNSTIGRLHWSVPGWVPGVGGNSISAPRLPKYHQGGIVSGAMGAETLAVLQAGERVSPAGGSGSFDNLHVTVELIGDGVLRVVRAEVGKRGGDPVRVLGNTGG